MTFLVLAVAACGDASNKKTTDLAPAKPPPPGVSYLAWTAPYAYVMTPPKIPINRTGRIVQGDEVGRFIRVEPDELGHFLIITSPKQDFVHGEIDEGVYDGWVEDEPSLNQYFAEAGWMVEWLE